MGSGAVALQIGRPWETIGWFYTVNNDRLSGVCAADSGCGSCSSNSLKYCVHVVAKFSLLRKSDQVEIMASLASQLVRLRDANPIIVRSVVRPEEIGGSIDLGGWM